MSATKRIVSASVCAALLLAGGIIGGGTNTVYAGAGRGSNATVKNLETLKNVIEALDDFQSSRSYALTRDAEGEEVPKKEYTSCTIVETANVYSTAKDSYSSESSTRKEESTTSFARTLGMYYTEAGSFYESDLQLSTSSSSTSSRRISDSSSYKYENISSKSKTTLDMHIQVYVSEEFTALYITRLNYFYYVNYQNSEKPDDDYTHTEKDTERGKIYGVLKEYCNRWVDCTDDPSVAYAFLAVDNANIKGLSSFGQLIQNDENKEESDLRKDGNVYKLKEKALLRFFGLSGYEENGKVKGTCTIDLSANTSPEIFYRISSSVEENYGYVEANYTFKNINNTVIKKPATNLVDVKEVNDRIEEMEEEA